MRILLLILLLPAADPTIDQLVERYAANRKEQAALKAAGETILADLRAALEALNKRLAELGVGPVVPPGPAPKPPAPPPDPADPLAVSLRAAYAADTAPTKADQAKVLAELYRQAADLAGDPAVTTTAQLMARIRSAASVLKIDGLTAVRKLIAAECAVQLGTDPDAAMTAVTRVKAKALFLRVHAILKGLN